METTSYRSRAPYVAPKPLLDDSFETFADVLDAAADRFADQEAYVHGAQRVTFRAWRDQADRLAGALVDGGLRPGDVLMIALEPGVDFAICFAAAQLAGAVGSGVNTRLGPREIEAILARSEPRVMIVEDGAPATHRGAQIIRRAELALLYQHAPLGPGRPRRRRDDPAVIIWTSGTTGFPKGAWFDHDNLKSAVRTSGPMGAPFARRLNSTPFAHAGYMSKVWEQVAFGMTLVITPTPWNAADTLRLLVDEKITIAAAVPTQWAKLLELPQIARADLSQVQVGITATAPAPPELVERVTELIGCPLIARYSMTECPSVAGTVPGDAAEVLYRTVGRPQAGVELALVGPDGEAVPPGDVGRIKVRAPGVMRGYWRDRERTAEALIGDGWLLTGDYGRFDAAGNLVLAGRTSEMYIRGGYNVYPIEVERVLGEHPAVAAVAVVGKPTPVIGEIGVAFVVPAEPAAPPELADLRAWARARLADYKAPDELVVVEALPLTSLMKIDKEALKTQLATP
jgi:acyl-CoA synthetase (AMP-forming)/AMP-acid ligase II